MESGANKKVRIRIIFPKDIGDEDRISRLPDELLHKILSFVDAKVAVQTSVLSRRWKPVWTSLPFLSFDRYVYSLPKSVSKFLRHVLYKRNHQSHLSELKFCVFYNRGFSEGLVEKFVEYAISHNVQTLSLEILDDHEPYKLSTFSSKSLEKLTLRVKLEECALESDYWDLPALTTLHLRRPRYDRTNMLLDTWLKDSWLTCLPALTTLCLYDWDLSRNRDLSQSSFSFSLPALKTLHLSHCIILPKTVWDLPDLISLQLDTMHLPENLSDTFSALVNLQNLTLNLSLIGDYFITCPPQLLNLSIKSGLGNVNIVVSAPKLCNFTFFGIFIVTILVPEPENINIRLQGWFQDSKLKYRKKYYQRLTNMLPGLGNATILTFDLESIEALNKISDLLVSLPSPFYNLKFVKLPWGFKESSISSALRNYLLGGSPKAAIGTKFPQNTMDYQEVPRCLTSQKFMLDEALATNVNDRASSSRGNSDFGLWRGHEVNPDFVGLLDLIITKYPETFEQFISKSEKFYTMKLNMLCTSVYEFLRTSLTEFNTDIITEYRDLFTDLQRWGFNVNWLLSHLKYIEHFQISQYELHSIDSRPDDAKNKLQDLQSHCLGKITEIEKASG